MSPDISTPSRTAPIASNSDSARQVRKRQPLSCLICRKHKLRCDRHVPCGTCVRYHREDRCRQDPAPRRGQRDAISSPSSPSLPLQDATEWSNEGQNVGSSSAPRASTDLAATPEDRSQLVDSVYMAAAARAIRQPLGPIGSATDGESYLTGQEAPNEEGASDRVPVCFLPQVISNSQRPGSDVSSLWSLFEVHDQKLYWREQLAKILPTRSQSDILLNYYIEHINWLFQTVHIPTFRKEYARFWETNVTEFDLIWVSLLFAIISLSALYVPFETIEILGLSRTSIRKLAHVWHLASQQALQAGEYEAKPCLLQLQTFSITQLYWYATNEIEILNSRLGQAVRNAQALNLDKDKSPSRSLKDEMRHRIWWDLVDSDTFQSICLDRRPLIQVHFTEVPLPLNCNDIDISENSVHPRPMDEPTEMSMNVFRAKIFALINRELCAGDLTLGNAYNKVKALDEEILNIMAKLPWYFQLDKNSQPPHLPAGFEFVTWQNHILRTCVCTQRIRMYKPFLSTRFGASWRNCTKAAEDALLVYRCLRTNNSQASRQKFFAQAYQIFSVAVTVAALLLVEGSSPFADARQQVEHLASDLQMLEEQGCPVPITVHGRKILLKMLSLCDQRGPSSPVDAQGLVPEISTILGGEQTTRAYIDRYSMQYLMDENASTTQPPPQASYQTSIHVDGNITGHVDFTTGSVLDGQLVDGNRVDFDPEAFEANMPLHLLNWDMTGLLWEGLTIGR